MKNKISKKDIDKILEDSFMEVEQYGNKTTVLKATLPNGFVIVESSSCVDPKNFDMKVGEEICLDKLVNKIWELEGYNLQSNKFESVSSVKRVKSKEELLLEKIHDLVVLPENYYLGVQCHQDGTNSVILYKTSDFAPNGFGYAVGECRMYGSDRAAILKMALSMGKYFKLEA